MAIEAPFLRRLVLPRCEEADYPFDVPLVREGFDLEFDRPVTFLCGENGSGKSTLLETLALICGFGIGGGNRDHATGQQDVDVAPLARRLGASWSLKVSKGFFLRAENLFRFASDIDGLAWRRGHTLNEISHGEAFLTVVKERFGERGIYILDEPEAAMSPQRQLALLAITRDLERTGRAQFIIATHSPLLMAYPGATFLWIDEDRLVEKSFRATPHFRILSRFFADPERYVAEFLDDADETMADE